MGKRWLPTTSCRSMTLAKANGIRTDHATGGSVVVLEPDVAAAEGGRLALGYPKQFHAGSETLIGCNAREDSKLETARLKEVQ
jgi:hypothetical protein